jgi:hypothetical protein
MKILAIIGLLACGVLGLKTERESHEVLSCCDRKGGEKCGHVYKSCCQKGKCQTTAILELNTALTNSN